MNDLSRHLIEADSHAYLPFHPACPTCRAERLAGVLHTVPLIPPRARAGLAAAVLATSALPPVAGLTAVAAAEEDQVHDGTGNPGVNVPPDMDGTQLGQRSGASTPLGDEQSRAGVGLGDGDESDGDEAGPLEAEPLEPDDPVPSDPGAMQGAGGTTAGGEKRPGGPEHIPGKAVGAPGSGPVQGGPPPNPGNQTPAGERERRAGDRRAERQADRRVEPPPAPGVARPQVNANSVTEPPAPVTASAPEPVRATSSRTTPPSDSDAQPSPVDRGADFHIVRPGESLWSIAAGYLGRGATSADIAALVAQLWTLNAAEIGTGDADLVMPGQRLRLR